MSHVCRSVFEENWENEVEWTGKAEIGTLEFLAADAACRSQILLLLRETPLGPALSSYGTARN